MQHKANSSEVLVKEDMDLGKLSLVTLNYDLGDRH